MQKLGWSVAAALLVLMFGARIQAASDLGGPNQKIILLPEQSTGGKILHLANGAPAVTLDSSCKDAGPEGAAIHWQTPEPLPPGWWRGTLELCPREGEERSWVN